MTEPNTFVGRAAKTERLYEAHLFLTCAESQIDAVVERARRRRFRRSSRLKTLESGAVDVLLTRNSDDERLLSVQLRALADDLILAGAHVYRIRLEQMMFDEVQTRR